MMNIFLSILLSILAPQHDFHTSWMNMTYKEKNKEFDISWRTDTEHLEGVLSEFSDTVVLLENTKSDEYKYLINKYINEHFQLYFNDKNQKLAIETIEVTFADTHVHFKPVKCKRKLKKVSTQNTLLLSLFPNQKNMVQINYRGEMYSMLLSKAKIRDNLSID